MTQTGSYAAVLLANRFQKQYLVAPPRERFGPLFLVPGLGKIILMEVSKMTQWLIISGFWKLRLSVWEWVEAIVAWRDTFDKAVGRDGGVY